MPKFCSATSTNQLSNIVYNKKSGSLPTVAYNCNMICKYIKLLPQDKVLLSVHNVFIDYCRFGIGFKPHIYHELP